MFKEHPKGLFVAFFANMGERFGFYTMMAILVLFLQAKYNLSRRSGQQLLQLVLLRHLCFGAVRRRPGRQYQQV